GNDLHLTSFPTRRSSDLRSGKKERISRIYQMHSNKQEPITRIEAGDIGAAVGFKDIKTGDTLTDEKHPIALESMTFPEPVIGIRSEEHTSELQSRENLVC